MYIVWGSGNYGKCDEVPGLCHVVTRFGHLYYLPLIPTGSFAVISEDGDGFRGAAIPMSGKSVFLGWLRAATVIGLISGVVLSIMGFTENGAAGNSMLLSGLFSLIASGLILFASYRMKFFGLASRERAVVLAEQLGLDEEGLAMINEMYDAMETATPDDDFEYNPGFVNEDPRFTNIEN